MAEFLKKEYRTTGKGFDFGENPVSVWFDESGMRAGYGTSAKENLVAAMSWQEVESHIRSMVENGTYTVSYTHLDSGASGRDEVPEAHRRLGKCPYPRCKGRNGTGGIYGRH